MKYKCIIIFLFFPTICMFGQSRNKSFEKVAIQSLLSDKISIRAIAVDQNTVFYAADKNRFGCINIKSKKKTEFKIVNDTLKLEFRSMAQTKRHIFVLCVGNPALLYKIDKKTMTPKLVYKEQNEKVFYDSMQFRDDKNGMAMGDPTENCLSVIITKDGGDTWQKQTCDSIPKIVDGEAAFAASNTNLILKSNKAWMVSGGKQARIFCSNNFGKTWQSYATPIVQGQTMTGIFSADFYDESNGIVVGGDYEKPTQNFGNKATTTDGGKTWNLVAENSGFGYASCVQYVPNSNAKGIVSVDATGVFYSNDAGNAWTQISTEKDLYVLKFINKNDFIAAGNDKILRFTVSYQ